MNTSRYAIMAGAGNTFAVLDERVAKRLGDPAELARRWCARPPGESGLRALDGVLIVAAGSSYSDCRMIVYNADGSRAQTCGNGIRCVARFARDYGLVARDSMRIATDAGVSEVELLRSRGEIVGARANMGPPRRIERDVELSGEFGAYRATLVDMGNPHCVLFVPDERRAPVAEHGAALERHARFPDRTNVEFAAERDRRLYLRVWERGVGETAACGTGACATAVAMIAAGRAGSRVELRLVGGVLHVDWDGRGDVLLTGPCEVLWVGTVEALAGVER